MKHAAILFILQLYCLTMAETPMGLLEDEVGKTIRSEKPTRYSISHSVLKDVDYYNVKNEIQLNQEDQENLHKILMKSQWDNSKFITSKKQKPFVILLKSDSDKGIGLLSTDSIERGCFYYIEYRIDGNKWIDSIYRREISVKNGEEYKSYQRVIRIPGWSESPIGKKIIAMNEKQTTGM